MQRQASGIAARSRQGLDQSGADRVSQRREHDRDDRRRLLRCKGGRGCRRDNDIHLPPDELGRDLGEALIASLRPANLDRDSAALYPVELAQSLHKGGDPFAMG